MQLARGILPTISYTYFNMEDPVVGGYTTDKVALRRAVSMAYNTEEEIRVVRQGQAMLATQPVPPGVTGHDPTFNGHVKYDPAGARALLDKFGYVDRDKDGWRDLPDGRPLVLHISSTIGALERQLDELWQRSLKAVGIRVEFVKQKFPDTLKAARAGQLQMWGLANTNTTTEGYGFLGLLYGGNAGLSNFSRFNLPEFNQRYEASRRLPDGPARTKLFGEMSALVTAYAPWMLDVYRYENVAVYPWVVGFKYSGIYQHPWPYLDIDTHFEARSGPMMQDASGAAELMAPGDRRGRAGRARAARSRRAAPKWADPAKTLRVMFPIAETGFDPQATSDYYSSHVQRAIFDSLYRFDYLARPYRFVPNTAAAMPEISADGRTWTIRIKPGIHFADDPAFKGKKRELTADDYVYAWKRLLDPRMRAPFLWYLDGKVVGAERGAGQGQGGGAARLRRADRRPESDRPLHAAPHAQGTGLRDAGVHVAGADGGGGARGDRGVWRRERMGDGESGRDRALSARRMAARAEDRARRQSGLSRGLLSGQWRARTTAT